MVRSMGREQSDLATLNATVGNFMERVYFLFKRGGCMTDTTLFDIVVNRAVAGAGARHLPGASEPEGSRSANVHLEDVQVGRHGKGGGRGRVPRLLGGHCFLFLCLGR